MTCLRRAPISIHSLPGLIVSISVAVDRRVRCGIWSKLATDTLVPRRTWPASGSSSPRMSFSSVVLPAPFGPSTPTLSPRRIVAEKSRTIGRLARSDFDTLLSSATSRPLAAPRSRSSRTRPTASRRCRRCSRSRSSRATRLTLRVRRASTPLRTQTSSCASSLSARALATLSASSSRSRADSKAAKLPGYERSRPRSSSTMRVVTASRNARSCVTTTSGAAKAVDEQLLQPQDRIEVEVVRRFVEQQHVGRRDQRACERNALPRAARQRVDARRGLELRAGARPRRPGAPRSSRRAPRCASAVHRGRRPARAARSARAAPWLRQAPRRRCRTRWRRP